MGTDDEMQADAGEQEATVAVAMPVDLLRAVDEFAAHNGYETPDAVVQEALARARERRDQ